MTLDAPTPGLDPAAVLPLAEDLPAVARKLAQHIEDCANQRARLTAELLADWHGTSRAAFDDGEAAHARRATELVAALRRLAVDVVDAATTALHEQQAADVPPVPAPAGAGGGRRPKPHRKPASWPSPATVAAPAPSASPRPSLGDADGDGNRDPGWQPGNVREDVPI